RGADTVQTTRGLVARAAELAARVQPRQHQFDAGDAGLGVRAGGDTAAVVLHLDAPVGVERDDDPVGVASHTFVGGVVDDLGEQVVDAAAVGRPDVHAGPLANRFQSLEVGQIVGPVQG